MGLGDALRRLLGGGSGERAGAGEAPPDRAAAVEYNGYRILPAPKRQGGQFLTAGVIEKDEGGTVRSHSFIRADTHSSADEAKAFSIRKAQQLIDEQGDRLFG
jgi:hypothetical protein